MRDPGNEVAWKVKGGVCHIIIVLFFVMSRIVRDRCTMKKDHVRRITRCDCKQCEIILTGNLIHIFVFCDICIRQLL